MRILGGLLTACLQDKYSLPQFREDLPAFNIPDDDMVKNSRSVKTS